MTASWLFLVLAVVGTGDVQDSARRIVDASGVCGGLVVHLGCGDGRLTAALDTGDAMLVHGLDTQWQNIVASRRHIQSVGLDGRVSVDRFDGRHLPYVDNLVNLLVVSDRFSVSPDEILRVLAPGGAAVTLDGGGPTLDLLRKPRPPEMDQWTHFLHGPDNNAVAEDRLVGPPRHMQWLAGPAWTRHHHDDKGTYPAIRAVVSAAGRLYYLEDETRRSNRLAPSRWSLAARDGFSGVLLWRQPIAADSYERRLEGLWRTMVADGQYVYVAPGTDRPLCALDGASGAVIRKYAGTESFQEVIKYRETLLLVTGQGDVLAVQADTGQARWRWSPPAGDPVVPLTLAASEDRVLVKTESGPWCLSPDAGTALWHTELQTAQKRVRLKFPRERLIVKDGVVLCSFGGKDPTSLNRDRFQYLGSHPRVHEYGGRLAALSADDGHVLWTTDYLPGLESTPGEMYVIEGLVWLGPDFAQPRDLRTGEIQQTRPVLERLWTTGHHYRCYPGKATCRFIITAKRGIEMFDLVGQNHSRNNWVRATCRVGVTPCNGLLYAPPHSCGCYMEAKLYGFWALAGERRAADEGRGTKSEGRSAEGICRLEQGPAFGVARDSGFSVLDTSADWPTYRHDPARSGSTKRSVSMGREARWTATLGGRLSAVTVADGRVFVARVDAHTVHALDADGGRRLWQFTAGGRIDSPPTCFKGLVLFGSRDGWVYCLRASDGELVWRFLAAPEQRNGVAFEQVESLWPAHGSVLVQRGVAYVAAGRSSYLDGGIALYGLDPETGQVRCARRLADEPAGAMDPPPAPQRSRMEAAIRQNNTDYKTFLAPDRSDAFSMRGARADVLTGDGDSVFMRHLRMDETLNRLDEKAPHLFSTSSLLDDREHHRSYWVLGTGDFSRTPVAYPWIVAKSLAVPYGLMLAFDQRTVWGVHRVDQKQREDRYAVFAETRADASDPNLRLPDFAIRSRSGASRRRRWTTELPLRPRAMVRAGDRLLIGGQDLPKPSSAASVVASETPVGAERGIVCTVAANGGDVLETVLLAAPPVWDGMAVAGGNVYAALTDGSVVCLGSRGQTREQ